MTEQTYLPPTAPATPDAPSTFSCDGPPSQDRVVAEFVAMQPFGQDFAINGVVYRKLAAANTASRDRLCCLCPLYAALTTPGASRFESPADACDRHLKAGHQYPCLRRVGAQVSTMVFVARVDAIPGLAMKGLMP